MMAILNSLILLFLFNFVSSNKIHVPVFLLDSDQVMGHIQEQPNPFSRMSTYRFSDLLHNSIRRSSVVLIFIENDLSSEDLSSKDRLGTPFHFIRQGLSENQVKYFPAVADPYDVLTQIFPKERNNIFNLQSNVNIPRTENLKYMYFYFKDVDNETRIEKLRRHDYIIQEACVLVRLSRPSPIIGVYTGLKNPREGAEPSYIDITPVSSENQGVMVISNGALYRFNGVYRIYGSSTKRFNFSQRPTVPDESFGKDTMRTRIAYDDFEIEFNYSFNDNGWIIDNVILVEAGEEVGRTDMRVGAPWNWSYVCVQPLVLVNTRDDSYVTISQYQVQPRVADFQRYTNGLYQVMSRGNNGSSSKFGDKISCGPYFNANILTALLVTFALLCITMFGVVSMFNCKNNDRYDDPNGQQLMMRPTRK